MNEIKTNKPEKVQIIKKSGADWGKYFGIEFVNVDGWFSQKEFETELITKSEFANRSSQCVFCPPDKMSRKAAQEFRDLLYNK